MAANVTLNFIRYEFFESETKKKEIWRLFEYMQSSWGLSRNTYTILSLRECRARGGIHD